MKTILVKNETILIVAFLMIMGLLFSTVSVNAAAKPECPSVTSLTSNNCSVTVKWSSTGNPEGTKIEVLDTTNKKTYNVQESKHSLTIKNLTAGQQIKIILRAASSGDNYICSNWTDPRKVTVKSGSGNAVYVSGHKAQKIKLNQWYSFSNAGKEDTDNWDYSKYYYYKAANSDSDYELYVKCSEGEVRVYPYYKKYGRWSRDVNSVVAEASCENSDELWFDEDAQKDTIGFEAIAASDYGEICTGKFMLKEK